MHGKIFSNIRTDGATQGEKLFGSEQIENSCGAFVWGLDCWGRLNRFLVLGTEGGSYYASQQQLTRENADAVLDCIREDGVETVRLIVELSQSGRAPKNSPALFALAMAAGLGNDACRKAALDSLHLVARTGTHLFEFASYVGQFRKWGRGLRRAVARWYEQKDAGQLAYQLLKYRGRKVGGQRWTHSDLVRKSHPRAQGNTAAVLQWLMRDERSLDLPPLIGDFTELQGAKSASDVISIINRNTSVSWEMVPSEFLGDKDVWAALLLNLPYGAMVRNLARMTANGLLTPMGEHARIVSERLQQSDLLRKARLHPVSVLGALCAYRQGEGMRGSLTWTPVREVVDALDAAFYASFGNVTPSGKRTMLALDVSASMTWDQLAGMPGVTPRMGSAAMAMVTARVEPQYVFRGFSHELVPIDISPRQRLDDVVATIERIRMGATNCALPMVHAMETGLEVDTFVVYTDSDTNCWGSVQPAEALRQYRQRTGIPARLVVVGMVSNGFTIADPCDPGMLDVVGFDTAAPQLISNFSAG